MSTADGVSDAIVGSVMQAGTKFSFENFTVVLVYHGRDLLGPADQILGCVKEKKEEVLAGDHR